MTIPTVTQNNRMTDLLSRHSIETLLEKHSTTRKLFIYLPPIFLLGSICLKNISSYDFTPNLNLKSLVWMPIWMLYELARECESSLQKREIKHLN